MLSGEWGRQAQRLLALDALAERALDPQLGFVCAKSVAYYRGVGDGKVRVEECLQGAVEAEGGHGQWMSN